MAVQVYRFGQDAHFGTGGIGGGGGDCGNIKSRFRQFTMLW